MLLNMAEPNQDYIQKLDECGNAYYTLSLSEEDETYQISRQALVAPGGFFVCNWL